MACTAAGDIAHTSLAIGSFQSSDTNSVFGDQVIAQRVLVGETLAIHLNRTYVGRRTIPHIKDLVTRPQILAGIAMAAKAPLHLQRLLLIHQWHGVNRAMTGVAADPFRDVDAVIEEDEVGKRVHPRPLQRLAGSIAGAYRFEQRRVGPNLRVAVHAGLGGWYSSKAGGLDRGVAVAAVNAESGNMMLVAEGDWLRLAHTGVGYIGGTLYGVTHPDQSCDDENRAENGGARQRVRAAIKDLRHSLTYEIWMRDPADRPLLNATVLSSE